MQPCPNFTDVQQAINWFTFFRAKSSDDKKRPLIDLIFWSSFMIVGVNLTQCFCFYRKKKGKESNFLPGSLPSLPLPLIIR